MEGKKFEWEAVALIPFIDADLLIKTHDEVDESLIAPEDRKRNQMGVNRMFTYDPSCTDNVPSPISNLPDLITCQSRLDIYTWPEFVLEKGGRFNPVLCEGVKIGRESTAGFPSLFRLLCVCMCVYSSGCRVCVCVCVRAHRLSVTLQVAVRTCVCVCVCVFAQYICV
jgi:5'-3' exonuclease